MSEDWSDEELVTKTPADVALLFAKAAAATDGRIIRFPTQYGDCFRVGSYTSRSENRRLAAKLRAGIDLLEETDRIRLVSGQVWELTDKGYGWAESDGGIQIPASSAVLLDLLLRVAITPRLWASTFQRMESPLARDEGLDALSQGALPLSQLVFEWAGTHGAVDLLARGEQEVDLTEFYDALFSLGEHFDLEMSVPRHPEHHGDLQVMPPFAGQRVRLVNRLDWLPLPASSEGEELAAGELMIEPPPNLPALTDHAVKLGDVGVGETWVRIAPVQIRELVRDPVALLQSLDWLANTRVTQLRDTLHQQQNTFRAEDLERLTQLLEIVTSWQQIVNGALTELRRVPPEREEEVARKILDTIKEPVSMDARARKLDDFVTELDNIVAARPIDDHGAGKQYRLSNWHDRVSTYLREHVSAAAATKFVAINAANASVQELPQWTREFRTYLLALQRDVLDHPEHHRPAPSDEAPESKSPAPRPVGPWGYAILAGLCLLLAGGLLVLLIRTTPTLAANGTVDRIYYVLLVIVGFASAAFLFGAMRSYASFTGKVLKGTLELGGPAVIACLVVIGGFMLAPRASTFTVTVRVVDQQRKPLHGGSLVLRAAAVTSRVPINDLGEADFRELPSKFRGESAEIVADVPGYVQDVTQFKLEEVVSVTVHRADTTETTGEGGRQ